MKHFGVSVMLLVATACASNVIDTVNGEGVVVHPVGNIASKGQILEGSKPIDAQQLAHVDPSQCLEITARSKSKQSDGELVVVTPHLPIDNNSTDSPKVAQCDCQLVIAEKSQCLQALEFAKLTNKVRENVLRKQLQRNSQKASTHALKISQKLDQSQQGMKRLEGELVNKINSITQAAHRREHALETELNDTLSALGKLEAESELPVKPQLIVPKPVVKAVEVPLKKDGISWYEYAALNGDVEAMLKLADMYHHGEDVLQDYTKSIHWYTQAAKSNNTVGQFKLALSYEKGLGVEQDYSQASLWYIKAAHAGHAGAQYQLGLFYSNGYGVNKNAKQALDWFKRSIGEKDATAQSNLGLKYYLGEDVPRDLIKAYAWTKVAALQRAEFITAKDLIFKELKQAEREQAEQFYKKIY